MKNLYRMMKLLLHDVHEPKKPKVQTKGHTVCYECYMYAFSETNDFLSTVVSKRRLMHIEDSFKQFREVQNKRQGKGIFKQGVKTGRIKKPFLNRHLYPIIECEICTKQLPKSDTERYEIEMLP